MQKEFKDFFNYYLFKPLGNANRLIEKYDISKLNYILANKKIIKKKLRKSLFKKKYDPFEKLEIYKKNSKNGIAKVKYDYKKIKYIGRLYSTLDVSMQVMPREIRQTLTRKHYDDIDISNAHPSLLKGICDKLKFRCPLLKYYVNHRDIVFKNFKNNYGMERDEIKDLILIMLYGGKIPPKLSNTWIIRLKEEFDILKKILIKYFPKTYLMVKKEKKYHEKENLISSFLFLILSTVENYILMAIIHFYKSHNIIKREAVLIFDGALIPKHKNNKKLLRPCEKFLKNQFKMTIKLKIKKMDEYLF